MSEDRNWRNAAVAVERRLSTEEYDSLMRRVRELGGSVARKATHHECACQTCVEPLVKPNRTVAQARGEAWAWGVVMAERYSAEIAREMACRSGHPATPAEAADKFAKHTTFAAKSVDEVPE